LRLEKGTLAGIRNLNRVNILEIVKSHEPVSRAKIAQVLRMSRSNVSDIVETLIQEGLLREEGTGESTSQGGRKPVHLRFVANAKYALGIDIGGTKTIALITDLKGNVVYRRKFPSHRVGLSALENIRGELTKLLEESEIPREKIVATGIGVPAITDYKTGEIVSSPGLFQGQMNVTDFFEGHVPGPVIVENDVNMGVIGECWRGNGVGFSNVALLAIGTGIGVGIVVDGKLYRGATGFAGEIGYLQVDPLADADIEVSHFGPLERVASGNGIERLIPKYLDKYPDTVLTVESTAEEIFQAMRQGDLLAKMLVENMVKYLSFAISNMISILNPQRIIIGGGVAQAGEDFIHAITSRVRRLIPVHFELVPAGLGEDAAAFGAAATALLATENMQLFS
jgi:glucokinase